MDKLISELIKNDDAKKALLDAGLISEIDVRGASIEIKANQDRKVTSKMEGNPLALITLLNDAIEEIKQNINTSDETYELLMNSVISNNRKADE